MDPVAVVMEKLNSVKKSSEDFLTKAIRRLTNRSRNNPIEIMKRLQRETFSDMMKLRDRQEKIEHMLSVYMSSIKNPFNGAATHLKGQVDVVGSLLLVDNFDQQICDILKNAGVKTGVISKFIFETTVRQKDAVLAEFVAEHNSKGNQGGIVGSPLALKKMVYLANINDWLSATAIPVGAQFKDVEIGLSRSQSHSYTEYSSLVPPLLNQYHGSAVGLMMKGANLAASLAQFFSLSGTQPSYSVFRRCLSTCAQLTFQPFDGTKATVLGLHQMRNLQPPDIRLDFLTIPLGSCLLLESSKFPAGPSIPSTSRISPSNASERSIAMMLETSFDERTRVEGWVMLQKSNATNLQWSVCLSDTPGDELRWGVNIGAFMQRPSSTWIHYQLEAFVNLNFGKKFSLQPRIIVAMNDGRSVPGLLFRSSWSL